MKHKIEIRYCTLCRWLLRTTWMAQELLTTFDGDIGEMSLQPTSGGVFDVFVNGKQIWCRKDAGRFPDIKRTETTSTRRNRP